MRLYDFGADVKGRRPEALKAVAWPVNAWSCYIPENVDPKLNILEKLVLSLVSKGVVNTQAELTDILVRQVGLNKELIDNVLERCAEKYFNQSYHKELRLRIEAQKLLDALEQDISPDMKMSDKVKKVYLFQDAVTGTVIPCFNIETLSAAVDNIAEENCIRLQQQHQTQPGTAAINNALRQWGRIFKAVSSGEIEEENRIDMETDASRLEEAEALLMESTKAVPPVDNEGAPKRIDAITVFDDEPSACWVKGYLAFNPSNPREIEIIAPFGRFYDNWFMKLVNKLRASDQQFENKLQLFLLEKTELFKDTVAFGNDLDIQLFDDFPIICNDSRYASLKKAIRDLSKDVARIQHGEDESTNFAKNLRTAIEVLFRTVIKANPEIAKLKMAFQGDNGFYQYKYEIKQVVETYQLPEELKQRFTTAGIYKNLIHPNGSNPKDNAALILLYANRHPDSSVMEFVKDYDYMFLDLFDLVSLGTDAGHAGEHFTSMYFSPREAEGYYSQYENMVRALCSCLIEETA